MSRANIVTMVPSKQGLFVTFQAHSGQRTYLYTNPAAVAGIMAGDEPSRYDGTEVSGADAAGAAIEGVADILEIL